MAKGVKLAILIILVLLTLSTFIILNDYDKLEQRREAVEERDKRIEQIKNLNILLNQEIDQECLEELHTHLLRMEEGKQAALELWQYEQVLQKAWDTVELIEAGENAESSLEGLQQEEQEYLKQTDTYINNLDNAILSLRIINELKSIQ